MLSNHLSKLKWLREYLKISRDFESFIFFLTFLRQRYLTK